MINFTAIHHTIFFPLSFNSYAFKLTLTKVILIIYCLLAIFIDLFKPHKFCFLKESKNRDNSAGIKMKFPTGSLFHRNFMTMGSGGGLSRMGRFKLGKSLIMYPGSTLALKEINWSQKPTANQGNNHTIGIIL